MTVEELINVLNGIKDKSIVVLVRGYEGGYADIKIRYTEGGVPEISTIDLNVNNESYYGPHEITEEDTPLKKNKIVKGIILQRESKF
jgi:hypothetical protein